MRRLIATSFAVLSFAALRASASTPTIGVEWEIMPTYTGVVAQSAIDTGKTPKQLTGVDPGSLSPQTVLCTEGTRLDVPIVSFSHDLDWIASGPRTNIFPRDYVEGARTLEIVSGPLEHDNAGDWAAAGRVTRTFFDALAAVCAEHSVPATRYTDNKDVPKAKSICFASAKAVADKMNETLGSSGPLHILVNSNKTDGSGKTACGDDAKTKYDLSKVGFFLQRETETTFYNASTVGLADANTQVNVALKLADVGAKPDKVATLLSDRDGLAGQALATAAAALKGSSQPAQVKGFLLLWAMSLNAETRAAYDGTMGFARKNLFDLYVKSPLGATYDAIKAGIAKSDAVQIDLGKADALEDAFCVVTDKLDSRASATGKICKKFTKLVEGVGASDTTTLNEWITGTLDPRGNPVRVSKPIAPIGSGADTAIVAEMRDTRQALNAAAHWKRGEGGAYVLTNMGTIADLLAPFKH